MNLWLIPLLPLAGAAINGLVGRRFAKNVVTAVGLAFPGAAMLWTWKAAEQFASLPANAIPQIENQIAQTEHGLSVLLGRNPGPIPRGKTLYALGMPPIPADLPSKLMERRPDILQADNGTFNFLYNQVVELFGVIDSAESPDCELGRKTLDPAGREFDAFPGDRVADIAGGEPVGCHLLRIQQDPDSIPAFTPNADFTDARNSLQPFLENVICDI